MQFPLSFKGSVFITLIEEQMRSTLVRLYCNYRVMGIYGKRFLKQLHQLIVQLCSRHTFIVPPASSLSLLFPMPLA